MNVQPEGFHQFLRLVCEDFEAAERDFTRAGLHALVVYRFGVWRSHLATPFRLLLYPVYAAAAVLVRNIYGIEISWRTRIGRRVMIAHQSGIVIHPDAVIGDDCLIRQNVTIGAVGGRAKKAPTLGNRVELGAGSVLIGGISVGDDVRIGPNAVVMTSIPAGSIVASPQPRIIPPPQRKSLMQEEEEEPHDIPIGTSSRHG